MSIVKSPHRFSRLPALIAIAGLAVFAALLYNYFTLTARHRLNTADLWVLELSQLLEIPHGGQPVP